MSSLTNDHVKRLRLALQAIYAGPNPQGDYWLFLYESLNVQLSELTSAPTFPLQVAESLVKLNAEGRAADVLDALEQEFSANANLVQVISAIRGEAKLEAKDVAAAARLKALKDAYLMLDGLPFINRGRLREILSDLLDTGAQARVGVVAGTPLSGKSWSLHLIRAYSKSVQPAKVCRIILDLQKLQPGNDPTVVWSELMKQLLSPAPPPPPPVADTKGGQYVQRLVSDFLTAWNARIPADAEETPWLLIVLDHLDKSATAAVGPAVVDFAEALALAAVEPLQERVRVLLLGFPRAFSPAQVLSVDEVAPREELTALTMEEVRTYLAKVGKAIGRGTTPETETAAEDALREADAKTVPEERRAALLKMSATLGRHVNVLARAEAAP